MKLFQKFKNAKVGWRIMKIIWLIRIDKQNQFLPVSRCLLISASINIRILENYLLQKCNSFFNQLICPYVLMKSITTKKRAYVRAWSNSRISIHLKECGTTSKIALEVQFLLQSDQCTVWTDDHTHKHDLIFYFLRILEITIMRWSRAKTGNFVPRPLQHEDVIITRSLSERNELHENGKGSFTGITSTSEE